MINDPKIISTYSSNSLSEISIKIYYIYDVYLGVNCNTKKERKFKKIMFKINNINSVINLSSLKPNSAHDTPLKIKPFEPILIPMDNFTIKIDIDLNHRTWELNGNGRKMTFEEYINIIIEYNESQKIGIVYRDITRIERLFTLLIGNSKITELKGIKENRKIKIITPSLLKDFSTNNKLGHIKLRNKNSIKRVFKNLLTNYDKMDSVYSLFYSINESKVNSNTLCVTYSQILENYHIRQKYTGEYLTKKEFKNIFKTIKKGIKSLEIKELDNNQELKSRIYASIEYSYEYSFKDRLIEIFNYLDSYYQFNKILERRTENNEESIEELAEIIKDSKNYYTHYGDEKLYCLK